MSENYVGIKWLQVWPAILKPQSCTAQTLLVRKWLDRDINKLRFNIQTNSSESEAANDNKKKIKIKYISSKHIHPLTVKLKTSPNSDDALLAILVASKATSATKFPYSIFDEQKKRRNEINAADSRSNSLWFCVPPSLRSSQQVDLPSMPPPPHSAPNPKHKYKLTEYIANGNHFKQNT